MQYYKKVKSDKGNIFLTTINEYEIELFHDWFTRDDNKSKIVFETYKNGTSESIQDTENILNSLSYDNSFLIINNSNNNVIGMIGLKNISETDKTAYMWLKMDTYLQYEKQIYYGYEAIECVLKYSFDYLNLNNIMLEVPTFNKQLLDIISVSNLNYIGNKSFSAKYTNGLFFDKSYYQITKEQFYNNISPYNVNVVNKPKIIDNLPLDNLNVSNFIDCNDFNLIRSYKLSKYIDDLEKWFNNPNIAISMGLYRINWNKFMIEQFLCNSTYVMEKDNNFIGYIHLYNEDYFNHSANLTIMVGNQKYKRQGYAYQALKF